MASSSTNLSISLFGYKAPYRSNPNSSMDIQPMKELFDNEVDDWSIHSAFFDKDDFDISEYDTTGGQAIKQYETKNSLLTNCQTILHHYPMFMEATTQTRKKQSRTVVHPADVMIEMGLLDSSDEDDSEETSVDLGVQEKCDIQRHLIGRRLNMHRSSQLSQPITQQRLGDWETVKRSRITDDNCPTSIALDNAEVMVINSEDVVRARSKHSMLSSLRRQFNNFLSKDTQRQYEKEFYV